MQHPSTQSQPFQPYQRAQQQVSGQFYNPSQQQYWNANPQFHPQIPMPQQHANKLNQNLSSPLNQLASQRDANQNAFRTTDSFKKSEFYPRDAKTESAQRSSSPTQEDTGEGYFLPDFIANEIDGQSPSAQLMQKVFKPGQPKQGSIIGQELESQQTQEMNGDHIRIQGLQQAMRKVCSLCNSETNPYEQVIERVSDQTRLPYYTHLQCLTSHSMQGYDTEDQARLTPSQGIIRGISSTISPQPKPLLQVNLTPDMLLFDFQLLHPMTQTNIFSLSNQSANHIYDQQNSTFLYNKLLCNATAVPFNMAVVKLRWDFLRDPAQIVDPYSNTLLPNLPQGQYSNMIQGLINFNDMQNHNDKNITITLKAQPSEQTFLQLNPSNNAVLHLNFNYSNFQEQPYEMQQHQIPRHFLPITHIIKNLYLSFILSTKDYEVLKEDTHKLLLQNPNLVTLLKPSQTSIQSQQRFVSTQPGASLHSLFQGAQETMYSPLTTQMSQMSVNQNPMMSPAGLSMQQNYNSPLNTQEYYRSSPKGTTFSSKLENQGSERTLQIDQLQIQKPQTRRMPSENLQFHEEFKMKKERNYHDQYNHGGSPAEDNQSFRKALTCNLEVSTFEGENQRKMIDQKRINDQSQSVGGSPKQNDIEGENSPTFLSGGGSVRNLFVNDHEEKGDFLNPSTLQKQKTLKSGQSKKGENRKDSGGSQGSKKSKKSSGSLRSGGSSSKSASSARQEEFDSESAQVISELKGQIVETARQQHGSKYLQKLLARASPDFVDFAINESVYHLHELMVDQYGNYFCQKLLQSSSSAQRHKILQVLSPNILKISCDRKGTHSMQCLIEMVNMPEEEEALRNGIRDKVIDLAFDANGTHVLQKVMLCMKEENIDFIFNPVYENLIDLSMDQNGLCVIKKIIAKIQGHEKRMKIGQKLSEHVVELVQSPYGNYAVQQALDNWPIQYCESIFEKLEPHLMQLSVQKFSSNVIEKVLENATYDTVERYLKALCEHEVMKSLIKNTYGFYVLQKLKEVVKRHGKPVKRIQQAIENTIQYVSDKSLKQKWQQLMA